MVAAVGAVLVAWIAALMALGVALGIGGGGVSFNLLHWEVSRLASFALNRSAPPSPRVASDADVQQYFDLLQQARAARRRAATGDPRATAQAAGLEQSAERLRVLVEARFEQAVARAARGSGLVERLPLFSGVRFVWPPPATGFSVPPHILILSPRNRIALEDTQLLRSDLSPQQAVAMEQDAERRPNTSALVDQIGGLGAYPSIVDENDAPLDLMQTVAHEWMHDYLAFHPLGARYAQSGDMTLINETVASLVGRELGSRAYATLGLPLPQSSATATATLEFNRTMHDLRLEVDALLKQGKVAEAEQRMDAVQKQLSANGYRIRTINQAYFAFYGSYGDSPASSSPLGGEVQSLRRLSPDLASFVHRIENVAQPSDVARLLREAS